MRLILDSCTLIYLIKAKLFEEFIGLSDFPVVIDSSVYHEVIIKGKENNYPDAFEAERLLNLYKIPIIPTDISDEIYFFRDKGETSCFILAKEGGICLTSDNRALKKLEKKQIIAIKLEKFFFEMVLRNKLSKKNFFDYLIKLESISAINPKSILLFLEKLKYIKEVENND